MATVLLAAALVSQMMGEAATRWLRYERDGVLAGQVWRVFTCHLAHLGWPHLLTNAVALALVAALLGKQQRASDWWVAGAASALAIGAGLAFLNPSVGWYVGLSGMVHGLFAAGCVALLRRHPAVALLSMLALAAKLAWEQTHPVNPAREAWVGGAIIVDAHLYGAAGGWLAGLAIHLRPLCKAARRLATRRSRMA